MDKERRQIEGQSKGRLPGLGPIDSMSLPESIKVGYATFVDYIHAPALLRSNTSRLFKPFAEDKLKIRLGGEYRLADGAKAHADTDSRATTADCLQTPVHGATDAPATPWRINAC